MGSQRKRFEEWLENRFRGPRDPHAEANLLAAADAFDAVWESANIQPEQLKLIVDAASHSRAIV